MKTIWIEITLQHLIEWHWILYWAKITLNGNPFIKRCVCVCGSRERAILWQISIGYSLTLIHSRCRLLSISLRSFLFYFAANINEGLLLSLTIQLNTQIHTHQIQCITNFNIIQQVNIQVIRFQWGVSVFLSSLLMLLLLFSLLFLSISSSFLHATQFKGEHFNFFFRNWIRWISNAIIMCIRFDLYFTRTHTTIALNTNQNRQNQPISVRKTKQYIVGQAKFMRVTCMSECECMKVTKYFQTYFQSSLLFHTFFLVFHFRSIFSAALIFAALY